MKTQPQEFKACREQEFSVLQHGSNLRYGLLATMGLHINNNIPQPQFWFFLRLAYLATMTTTRSSSHTSFFSLNPSCIILRWKIDPFLKGIFRSRFKWLVTTSRMKTVGRAGAKCSKDSGYIGDDILGGFQGYRYTCVDLKVVKKHFLQT